MENTRIAVFRHTAGMRIATLLLLALLLTLPRALAVPVYELLAEFHRPGQNPGARLVQHPDGNFYGTTLSGGTEDLGTIFKLTPGGTLTTLAAFTGAAGAVPGALPTAALAVGADGALYGTTAAGGANEFGTVFKITTAGVFTPLLDFTGDSGAAKGSVPNELLLHADGFFYGTTQAGGVPGFGTIFKMSALGALTTLVEFTGTSGTRKGASPVGVLAASGTTLYGVAQFGGVSDAGVVFSVNTGGTGWSTIELTGNGAQRKGAAPAGGVVVSGGFLYGATEAGGAGDKGTLFRVQISNNAFTTLRQFDGTDGAHPLCLLCLAQDGFFYGTTSAGGDDDEGLVFKISPTGTFTPVGAFTGIAGAFPGEAPLAGLITTAAGNLAGTTSGGAFGGGGSVFTLSPSAALTTLATFSNALGWSPAGAPVPDAETLIFPNSRGGAEGGGAILRVQPGQPPQGILPFTDETGAAPAGGLLADVGTWLGVATGGGSGGGTIYRMGSGELANVASFTGTAGGSPDGPLVRAEDGNFYGVSRQGASGYGGVFRLTPAGALSLVAPFTGAGGAAPGYFATGPLAAGGDGFLYGVTTSGGPANTGTLFRVSLATGAFLPLTSFDATGPRSPVGGLVRAADGFVYGTTTFGGAADYGTVFKIHLGAPATIAALSGIRYPRGPLLAAPDGTLYGVAREGGAANAGGVFRITPGGALATVLEFTGRLGAAPGAEALALGFAGDGALCGVAEQGGAGDAGVAFRITGTGPHAGTGAADSITGTTLQAHGTVLRGGEATNVWFDYGPTPAMALSTPAQPATASAFSAPLAGLPTGSLVHFRARASNASGTSAGLPASATTLTASAAWKLAELGDANAPDLGDADADGLANILEYALTLPPLTAAPAPAPQRLIFPEGPRLTLTLQRDSARNDITIEVQSAPSAAGPWDTVATSVNGAPFTGPGYVSGDSGGAGIKTVTIKDTAGGAERFIRVKVTK